MQCFSFRLSKLSLVEVELKSLKKSSQQLKKDCEAKQKEIVKLQQMVSISNAAL